MMKNRKLPTRAENSLIRELKPLIGVGAVVVGIVVWAFNTFAQISYVKEQNTAMLATIEQRHKEAIEHSDMNRDRMLSVLMEVKETVKTIENRFWSETNARKH